MTHTTETRTKAEAHETQVIGSLILRPVMFDDIADHIDASSFASPRLALIWDAIAQLREANHPVDALTVSDQLDRDGLLKAAGGLAGIFDLASAVTATGSAEWHAHRVRDAAMLRRVAATGSELVELASAGSASEDEALAVVDAARSELDRLSTRSDTEPTHEAGVWAAIDALDDPPGDPTPWPKLTRAIAGWKPGGLYVIAARPSIGKSVAGVQVAVDVARRGKPALIYSMEMTRTELYHRMLVAAASVDMTRLQNRELTDTDHEKLRVAAADIAALPLIVDDQSELSVAQIRARVRAAKRRGEVGVVVVDYLTLVKPARHLPSRVTEVDEIARGLKRLAMEMSVPVVAMAQINRGPEQRQDKMPVASDLRESGGIEAGADVVVVLHRDPSDAEYGSTMYMGVAKNRHGPLGRFEFAFQGHYSRIVESCDA